MEERIEKYWRGELDKSEMEKLLVELEQHESFLRTTEGRDLLESVANTLSTANKNVPHREHVLKALHNQIRDNLHSQKSIRITFWRSPIVRTVAAILAVFFGIKLLWDIQDWSLNDNHVSEQQTSVTMVKKNNSDKDMALRLPDESVVVLAPHSAIRWLTIDSSSQRLVALNGKARFDVARDTLRPFSVQNNGYTTTALGTSFIVDDSYTTDRTSVELLSGKVVVQTDSLSIFSIGEVYLSPGDKIDIHVREKRFALSHKSTSQKKEEFVAKAAPDASLRHSLVTLTFHKEKLSHVLRAIADFGGKEIIFREQDIRDLTFTGDLTKLRTADRMLEVVCRPNQLKYTYENDRYIVTLK